MARNTKNLFTQGTQGAVGKEIVFKKINGKTFIAKYPDMTNVQYNNVQKGYQSIFSQAVDFATSILKDPGKLAEYENKIRNNKRTRGRSVYHYALQEFIAKHSKKIPKHVVKALLQQCLDQYILTDRQAVAIKYLISQSTLTNAIYQKLTDVSKPTATRDLQDLTKQGLIAMEGKGAGAKYKLVGIQPEPEDDDDDDEE